MTLKPPGPEPKVHDVDDAHADRFHGHKKDDAHAQEEKKKATAPKVRTYVEQELRRPEVDPAAKKRAAERVERKKDGEPRKDQPSGQGDPEEPAVTAGRLAFDDNHTRRHAAREMGLDGSPSIQEIVDGFGAETPGASLGEMLPRLRHPDLHELEIEPPRFLAPLQAMEDIYMRTRGRMTRKTKEILTSPDLEDLIALMHRLFDDATLVKKSEARHLRTILDPIGKDPGPLLVGFSDPRLTELWRLLVEGWDIWVPEGKETGVDLFWEGEAEDEHGNVLLILQSLQFREGEATLTAQVGDAKDKITFDGKAFYRLKHDVE